MNVTIKTNKKRIPTVFIASLAVSCIFFLGLISDHQGNPWFNYLPLYVFVLGYAVMVTVVSLADYLKTLFDRNAKLTITDGELFDNLSIFSCGKISYDDISDVEIKTAFNTDLLIIRLYDSNKYLNNQNSFKRYFLKLNVRKWGSPLVISEKRIEFNLEELKEIILSHKSEMALLSSGH